MSEEVPALLLVHLHAQLWRGRELGLQTRWLQPSAVLFPPRTKERRELPGALRFKDEQQTFRSESTQIFRVGLARRWLRAQEKDKWGLSGGNRSEIRRAARCHGRDLSPGRSAPDERTCTEDMVAGCQATFLECISSGRKEIPALFYGRH
ncbi:hypothetical protein LUU34_01148900 [Aix galericulata]|nr:hypothetical protein LUU34_01148900 [Aix galericulata]